MKKLEIVSEDLGYNIEQIKNRANNAKIIAVVKGNAYGLGLKEFVQFAKKYGITDFAVSSIDEAIELANQKMDVQILCMQATGIKEELEELLDNDIIMTIGDKDSAKILNEIAKIKNKKAHVHIKVDTGFSRYGFLYTEKENIVNTIKECTSIYVDGVFSHFSYAYFPKEDYTRLQYNRFLEVKDFLQENNIKIPTYHIANSSAFLKYDDMFMDAVRIGSAFLGRLSVPNAIGLKKIATLKSNISCIKKIKKGTPIGYSNSEIAKKDMTLAIVPVGYADGFNVGIKNDTFKFIDGVRLFKNSFENLFKNNRLTVIINSNKYYVIGKVGMNHITIDVTDGDVKTGDIVELEASPILVSDKIRREYI